MNRYYTKTNVNAYISLIETLAEQMRCELRADVAPRLAVYLELVAAWNRRVGLTGARDANAQVQVLIADALVIASARLIPPGSRLLDVGSGAGAPAIPLLVVREDLSALLVEPKRKRVAFLRTAAEKLGLTGRARVLEQRLDPDDPLVPGGPFDVAMSRATFPPGSWLDAGMKLARRTLVFTARETPPVPPAGSEQTAGLGYRLPSGASRRITVYSAT
jgi:16S rRNA (guanine527-N7)-methyltransferase